MIPLSTPIIDSDLLAANGFCNSVNAEYNRLKNLLDAGATLIWSNPNGLTPQQAVANFGTNAAALFSLSALLCGLIGAISGTAPSPMPVGWSFTANSDGTVTLTPPAS
jgi:hypothetical protein